MMSPCNHESLLSVAGLSVSYGGKALVLSGIDLSVGKGEIVAILGANGAGKTTLIRAISGLLKLHGGAILAGQIKIGADDTTRLAPETIVRLGLGQVPEGRLVFKNLTVEENLDVGAAVLPREKGRRTMAAVYHLFPRLAERRTQLAGLMSGGEQQMLALGRALASSPRLILVDELSLGLAPLIVRDIYAQFKTIRSEFGTSMLIVEQNARLALDVSERAYVLERGEVVLSGLSADVATSARIHESYLGVQAEASHG